MDKALGSVFKRKAYDPDQMKLAIAVRGDWEPLRKCIIDKNARIGSNVQIVNAAGVQEANHEEEGYIIKDGIVVVVKDAVISDGTII